MGEALTKNNLRGIVRERSQAYREGPRPLIALDVHQFAHHASARGSSLEYLVHGQNCSRSCVPRVNRSWTRVFGGYGRATYCVFPPAGQVGQGTTPDIRTIEARD